jgi:hypothetical protein
MAIRKEDALLWDMDIAADLREGRDGNITQCAVNLAQDGNYGVAPRAMLFNSFLDEAGNIRFFCFTVHGFSLQAAAF